MGASHLGPWGPTLTFSLLFSSLSSLPFPSLLSLFPLFSFFSLPSLPFPSLLFLFPRFSFFIKGHELHKSMTIYADAALQRVCSQKQLSIFKLQSQLKPHILND